MVFKQSLAYVYIHSNYICFKSCMLFQNNYEYMVKGQGRALNLLNV